MAGLALFTLIAAGAAAFHAFADDAARTLKHSDSPWTAVRLESLDLGKMTQDCGAPQIRKTVDGNPITLNGVVHEYGVGTHASSEIGIDLKGKAARFVSDVGIDDERAWAGSVVFTVIVDGKIAVRTPLLHGGDKPVHIDIPLTGARLLALVVEDGGDGIDSDHADWADAVIFVPKSTRKEDYPEAITVAAEKPMAIAHDVSARPRINGPRVVGTTPGYDFLFLISATGKGPLTFSSKNLPAGLKLDSATGIISGTLAEAGTYQVELIAKGPAGTSRRMLTIVGGERKLALTPPMGWNSWNVWGRAVDAEKVRDAADWMVKSGLAAHGYQYVNIDDAWEGGRDENGEIQPNEKFGDMKALADYVHSKGLKLGIYSSPGPQTCAGFEGSWHHEKQDAATYAKWSVDYLKYDLCSYINIATGEGSEKDEKPYRIMGEALAECERDILYSLCQFGCSKEYVWKWGAKVGGNLWRTAYDIIDSWRSMSENGFSQNGRENYAGPGGWNDPDMLVVGMVGWGPDLRPSRLKPNEQITHITLWSLLAAPMLIGCDMTRLDQFTLDLLTNDDVIAVNQDPLGKQARRMAKDELLEVWARPLWDGTQAVGLFNRGYVKAKVTAKWSDLNFTGKQPVRNLWRKRSLGLFDNAFSAVVPAHGAVLVKIGKPCG